MDHEVVPRSWKVCDWLLNSSWDHFGLHQGTNVKVTMKFKVPKKHILRSTLFIGMIQRVLRWERQKRCSNCFFKRQGPMAKNGVIIKKFIEIYYEEENIKTREWSNLNYFFQNCPFWTNLNKPVWTIEKISQFRSCKPALISCIGHYVLVECNVMCTCTCTCVVPHRPSRLRVSRATDSYLCPSQLQRSLHIVSPKPHMLVVPLYFH